MAARVAKLILGCIWDPFWRRGGCRGSAVVQFERVRLSIVTIATLSKHSATVCCHISDTIIERGRSVCGKIWGGRGRSMSAKSQRYLVETWSCRMQKKSCRYLLPFEHNARTWQTDKPRNSNVHTNRRNHLSAMSMLIDKWSHGEVVNCILCCMLITYTVLMISSTSSTQLVSAAGCC